VKRSLRTLGWALPLLALGTACNTPPYNPIDDRPPFGAAKRAVELRQTQNPQKGDKPEPVQGVGATTAAGILTNYKKNQETEIQERRQDRQRDRGISEIGSGGGGGGGN
jgi:hypothetical protein